MRRAHVAGAQGKHRGWRGREVARVGGSVAARAHGQRPAAGGSAGSDRRGRRGSALAGAAAATAAAAAAAALLRSGVGSGSGSIGVSQAARVL